VWFTTRLVSRLTKHGIQFPAEVAVHERVDDRVSDVVEEVDVEDQSTVRDNFE